MRREYCRKKCYTSKFLRLSVKSFDNIGLSNIDLVDPIFHGSSHGLSFFECLFRGIELELQTFGNYSPGFSFLASLVASLKLSFELFGVFLRNSQRT